MGFDYQRFIEEEDAKGGKKKRGNRGPFLALLMLLVALALAGLFGAIYFGYLDLTNIPIVGVYLDPEAGGEEESAQDDEVITEPAKTPIATNAAGEVIYAGDVPLEFVALTYLSPTEVMISVERQSKVPTGTYPAMIKVEGQEDALEFTCEVLPQYSPNRLYCTGSPIRAELNVEMVVMQRADVVGNVNVLEQAGLLPQLDNVLWTTEGQAEALAGPLQTGISPVQGCVISYESLTDYVVQNQWDAWNAIAYVEGANAQLGVALPDLCQHAHPEVNLLDTPAGDALSGCLGSLLTGTDCEGFDVIVTLPKETVLKDFGVVFDCLNNPATCKTLSVPPTPEEGAEPVIVVEAGVLSQAQACAVDLAWETPVETAADVLAVQERVTNMVRVSETLTENCQGFSDTLAEREHTVDAFAQVQACIYQPWAESCSEPLWANDEHNMPVTLYQTLSQQCADDLQWTGGLEMRRDYAELVTYVSAAVPWVGQDAVPDACIALVNFSKDFGYHGTYADLLADALRGRLRSPDHSTQAWSQTLSFKIPIPTCPQGQYYEAESGVCRVEK